MRQIIETGEAGFDECADLPPRILGREISGIFAGEQASGLDPVLLGIGRGSIFLLIVILKSSV